MWWRVWKGTYSSAAPVGTPLPTPEELSRGRHGAVARLRTDHASGPRLARRLTAWALQGLHGGAGLEKAVASAPDARLTESWQKLLTPERFIRLHRKARTE